MRTLPALLLAAACSQGGAVDTVRERLGGVPPPLPSRADDSCHSAGFRQFVGQPAGMLSTVVIVQPVRYFAPGDPVPEDYSPVRLNFDLDQTGTITRVWCG